MNEPLNIAAINERLKAIRSNPPIRWGRSDAVALIEGDIPALLAELARLQSTLAQQQEESSAVALELMTLCGPLAADAAIVGARYGWREVIVTVRAALAQQQEQHARLPVYDGQTLDVVLEEIHSGLRNAQDESEQEPHLNKLDEVAGRLWLFDQVADKARAVGVIAARDAVVKELLASPSALQGQIKGLEATWRSIESAPKNQEILVFTAGRVYEAEYITDSDPDVEGWYFSAQAECSADWPDPLCWMPLPAPPTADALAELEKSVVK